jgi:hypothetical protein
MGVLAGKARLASPTFYTLNLDGTAAGPVSLQIMRTCTGSQCNRLSQLDQSGA